MTDITPTASDTADLESRNLATATRLFVAADAFLFLGFLFAYLYLRALNNNDMWNPKGQNPSGTMGLVLLIAVVVTAGLTEVAVRRMSASGPAAFRGPAAAALVVSLVATVIAGIQLFNPGFSPSSAGGFGSVFVGYMVFYSLHVLGGAYWLETQVVKAPSDALRGAAPPIALYWWSLAVVALIFSILFYVV
jgi:heme/copper-type cytochrome/quinol oxidase subunit 3